MLIGTVKNLRLEKAFGFIAIPGDKEGDHFFHRRDCVPPELFARLKPGDKVRFESELASRGLRARAVQFEPIP